MVQKLQLVLGIAQFFLKNVFTDAEESVGDDVDVLTGLSLFIKNLIPMKSLNLDIAPYLLISSLSHLLELRHRIQKSKLFIDVLFVDITFDFFIVFAFNYHEVALFGCDSHTL